MCVRVGVCVLEPPGDMLYFEVIKLFNCVSIFWNGIISSLKMFLKTLYLACFIPGFNDSFLEQHGVNLFEEERQISICSVEQDMVMECD